MLWSQEVELKPGWREIDMVRDREAALGSGCQRGYQPRSAQQSVLYRVIDEHLSFSGSAAG